MIIVTVTPYDEASAKPMLRALQARYPDVTLKHRDTDPGRYAASLPSKDEHAWRQEDADFFNALVDREVLAGWAILGGLPGV